MNYAGLFWGYRERPLEPAARRPRMPPPKAPLRLPGLNLFQIDALETPTFESRTFGRDYAGDDFPDGFTLFGFLSREIILWLKEGAVDVIYTFDGENALPMRRVTASYRAVEAVQGYKIRNAVPGARAWYEMIALR